MHSALKAPSQPLVKCFQIVEVWPQLEKKTKKKVYTGNENVTENIHFNYGSLQKDIVTCIATALNRQSLLVTL